MEMFPFNYHNEDHLRRPYYRLYLSDYAGYIDDGTGMNVVFYHHGGCGLNHKERTLKRERTAIFHKTDMEGTSKKVH